MSKISNEQIDELIGMLQGTCDTLDSALRELTNDEFVEDDLSEDNHDKIANEIFLCEECGWWCETSESNESESGENICDDCNEN